MTVLEKKPALLTFVFARCYGMCSSLLQSVNQKIESAGDAHGYQVLVLSFDPRDTANDMDRLKQGLALSTASSWSFCVAVEKDIERITRATGFSYTWDRELMQFDHPAMVAALDRGGRIIRTLDGLPIDSSEFKSLLKQLKGEFVPVYPVPQKPLLSCIRFDPQKLTTHFDWGFAVLLLPTVFSVLATVLIFRGWSRG